GSGALTPTGVAPIIVDSGLTATISAPIVGAGGLQKTGLGTLVLTGTDTYAGGTTISAGTLQIGNGGASGSIAGDVTDNAMLAFNRSDSVTFAGVISGSGGLQQNGAGTLTLTGANTYSGGTTINAGTLYIGDVIDTGKIGGAIVNNAQLVFNNADTSAITSIVNGASGPGGTVSFNNASTAGDAAITNTSGFNFVRFSDTSSGGNAKITNSAILEFDDASMAGNATIANIGFLVRFGENSTAGAATITNNGIVAFYDASTAGAATITNSGTAVFYNASTAGAATITNYGIVAFDDASTAGNATITNSAANNGVLVFNNSSTAGNATIISNSFAQFFGTSTAGNAVFTSTSFTQFFDNSTAGNAAIQSSGSVDFSTSTGPNGDNRLSAGSIAGTGYFNLGADQLTVGGNNLSTEVSGSISGAGGSLVKVGSGTLTLSGANTYSGGTTITAGLLQIGAGGTSGSIVGAVADNAILAFDRSDTYIFSGVISGTGTVNQIGAGAIFLSGANTYSGGTMLSGGGTLQVNNANGSVSSSAGTGAVTLSNGSVFQAMTSGLNFANAFTLAGVGGQIETTTTLGDTLTLSGLVSGAGGLRKTGVDGTLILTGANTYSGGTEISQGIVQVMNANGSTSSSVGTGAVYLAGGVFQAGANNLTFANAFAFNADGTPTSSGGGARIDTNGYTLTLSGVLSDGDAAGLSGTGPGALAKHGAGALILTNANTYSGGTYLFDGTIGVGNSAALGAGGLSMAAGTTLQAVANNLALANAIALTGADTIDAQANALTLSGVVSGGGGLAKIGSGELTLTAANTYTGATTVSAGVLNVAGSLGQTAVTVASGGTLEGTGSIAGSVTIASGGTLTPGDAPGTINVGALTLNSGSILSYQLGTANVVGGATNDLTIVNGALTINGGTLNVTNSGSFGLGVYQIIDYAGALGGGGQLTIGSLPNGDTGIIQTAIPGEVNLVVSGPGALTQFWDGATTAGDGTIHGGSGTWNNSAANWTTPNGTINASWQGGMAVFEGAAGTVTVGEAVSYQGLQFSTTGYVVAAT
ncbi:autotransporter-associated beta strand repeat-containing protein, partial [Methylocapsa sp. S129]|uniref:autotransporter-associated beta strand repeat-containing protein n=1 Tax=Methylocapsa sp. S129 TaxID=1641869 RepID=UPI001576CDBC